MAFEGIVYYIIKKNHVHLSYILEKCHCRFIVKTWLKKIWGDKDSKENFVETKNKMPSNFACKKL
jgi:hypothetical protein